MYLNVVRIITTMVVIILPTKNEAASIHTVITDIRNVFNRRIIVVDGHSVDGTRKIARKLGADVILDHGKGKGDALRTAFDYVFEYSNESVVFVDADGSYPVDRIPDLVNALKDCDMVIGDRVEFAPGSLSFLFRLGDWVSRALFRLLYGRKLDNLSGFRGMTRSAIEKMNLTEDGFGIETEITAKAARLGLRIKSVPIEYWKRDGRSKFRPVRDGLTVLRAMIRYRWWKPD